LAFPLPFHRRLLALGAPVCLSTAGFRRLALPLPFNRKLLALDVSSAFQQQAACAWRFCLPFNRRLLALGVSVYLSTADCLRATHVSSLRLRRPTDRLQARRAPFCGATNAIAKTTFWRVTSPCLRRRQAKRSFAKQMLGGGLLMNAGPTPHLDSRRIPTPPDRDGDPASRTHPTRRRPAAHRRPPA